ncbi:LysO family transporter [Alicyclobacillus sp.]|uniref:LysO family transporter n=1 Tax=Alicyclobacillus sp. TaxID=61169 RepID=UPI0025BF3F09|nr:LysO family transporter [Alicyclobacillus sp.]MCL6517604.1 lysine exporter LysO family protein [Alicyclobacillus sp.]
MLWLIVTFAAGLAAGRFHLLPAAVWRRPGWLVTPVVLAIVLIIGYELGGQPDLLHRLPSLGAKAVVIALFSMAASALLAAVTASWWFPEARRPSASREAGR